MEGKRLFQFDLTDEPINASRVLSTVVSERAGANVLFPALRDRRRMVLSQTGLSTMHISPSQKENVFGCTNKQLRSLRS